MRLSLAVTLLATLILGACTSIKPTYDYDENYSFDSIKSFAMAPRPAAGRANALVSDMTHERLEDAIVDKLKSMGLRYAGKVGNPDVTVSYHLVTQDKQDIRTYNTTRAYRCWRCMPAATTEVDVIDYTEGTLIVDMVDSKLNQSVWRSVVSKRVQPKQTPEERREMAQKIIDAIFADFPPGAAAAAE